MRTYRQLSLEERYQIQALMRSGQRVPQIARALDRSPSTIYRELARNKLPQPYREQHYTYVAPAWTRYNPGAAQRRTAARRIAKGEAQRKIRGELKTLVESKLRLAWSPEQICGRLREETGQRLSHETIYQHILRDSRQLGFYRYCLRFGGYKHHRFKKSKVGARTRARKNWIEDRPSAANDRSENGHWERDILVGQRGHPAILTLEDRRSRYVRLRAVRTCDSAVVARATQQGLHGLPLKTITNDNGAEFQRDDLLQRKLGVNIYFCTPSSPWQRGSVENTNGLLRQYFSKGFDLDRRPRWMLRAVENSLNLRPRKTLGFKTPHEVFHGTKLSLINGPTMHFELEFSSLQ